MSAQDDGGPAFPLGENNRLPAANGMSLRDFFAAQALAALIAEPQWNEDPMAVMCQLVLMPGPLEKKYAQAAYLFADAMLAERCAEKEDAAG